MEKKPLKGNSKSIALQSLVGSLNKNSITGSGISGGSSAGVTYQSVSKKVMCPFKPFHINQSKQKTRR